MNEKNQKAVSGGGEILIYGNPENFIDEEDGVKVISYEKVYKKAEEFDGEIMLGMMLLFNSFENSVEDNNLEEVSQIILVISDIAYILSGADEISLPQDASLIFQKFLNKISKNQIFFALSRLNDFFDSMNYEMLQDEEKSEDFKRDFFAAINLMRELKLRESLYLASNFSFIYQRYLNLEENIKKIRDSGKNPYVDFDAILEHTKEGLRKK